MATERLYFSSDETLNIEMNADDIANIERHESRYVFAAQQLTPNSVVLDCACGSGYGSNILKDYCSRVTGVDIDFQAVQFANSKYTADNLTYICGDIRELADSLDSVDTVVCLETLEHVPDPRILLDGFMKVLKVDGQLIISTPIREASRENPLNGYHVLEFTHNDLKRILYNYFHKVEIRLQDQDRFIRIDEELNWGFAVAICQYPKNMTIECIDSVIQDREIKDMTKKKAKSYISESAYISDSVLFKPSIDDVICDIAEGAEIRDNTIIETHNQGKFNLGKNSILGYNCWVNATGNVDIGENTLIGANTVITSSSHHIRANVPVSDQGMSFDKVTIGSNVWIGSNVSILMGVTIGDNVVIGTNCVVKSDVGSNTVLKAHEGIIEERKVTNKVAFYMLPFEIRENALTFDCIYDRYKKLAESFRQQDWDVVFVSTNELAKKISEDGWNTVCPSKYNIEYDNTLWFDRWKRVLNGEKDNLHQKFLSNMLQELSPEIMFCWNYDGLLKQECKKNNTSIYFNELGISRTPNPTIYYSDPEGVNSQSSFIDFWDEFKNFRLSEYERTIARLTLNQVRNNYCQLTSERKEIILDKLNVSKYSNIILIVLQVEDDSNIVAGSKYSSMQEFVDDCLQLSDESVGFIIKKHPGQPGCEIIVSESVSVVEDEFSTEELIEVSDSIFTINSSLGFEACIAGKSVYTFGVSPYTVDGLINNVKDNNIQAAFQNTSEVIVENELLLTYVYLTYHQYFMSPQKFFDSESHIRRHTLKKRAYGDSKTFFFDSGSLIKERELEVNRFQNKVLQDSILGYEQWIKSLKETEKSAVEVSDWAQSLNLQLQQARDEIKQLKQKSSHGNLLAKLKAKLWR